MDTQILRKPAAGQVWKNRHDTYFHVVAIANEEHKHEKYPVTVIYRSMRSDNGQPSHWWTKTLETWHEKMMFVCDLNSPSWAQEQQSVEDARLTGNASGLYGRVVACHGNGAQHYTLGLKILREDMPDHIVNNELMRVIFNRAKRPAGEVCAANHTGHNFGPYGPNGVTQCEYCGEAY